MMWNQTLRLQKIISLYDFQNKIALKTICG